MNGAFSISLEELGVLCLDAGGPVKILTVSQNKLYYSVCWKTNKQANDGISVYSSVTDDREGHEAGITYWLFDI